MLQFKNFFAMVKTESPANHLIMLILLSYPALLLTVKGSMGVLFGLLLIISAVQLYGMRKSPSLSHWDGYSIAFALAMASPMVAIFLSQAYHGNFRSPPYDWASRFLLSIPIFLALRQTNIRVITVFQYGIPLGTIIGLIVLKQNPFTWDAGRYTTSQAFNLVHFSDTALMLGFLSIFCINWERKYPASILVLIICGFSAGIYISIQSGERGGWLAIPPLLLLWVATHSKEKLWLTLSITTLLMLCAIWISYTIPGIVHERVDMIFSDLSKSFQGDKDTSIGIRLQLWKAALHLFIENPFFGVGPNGFEQAIPALKADGMLTPYASQLGYSEIHNEILAKCANTGLFGLISILAIYLVPIFIFWRSTKATKSSVRIAGFMGICFVSGFFIFGLTAEIFNLKMTAAFFGFTLAVLMAAATNKSTR
ncbi:MAG: O-antigen [Gallionellaceae bacterium]|nr:MAG: O-antigen [Gallionellaceae bacterium]